MRVGVPVLLVGPVVASVLALSVALPATSEAASEGKVWYWSAHTASYVANTYIDLGHDRQAHIKFGREIVQQARCYGFGKHIYKPSGGRPLFHLFLCNLGIGDPAKSNKLVTRREWVALTANGPVTNDPTTAHHFSVQYIAPGS